MELQSREILGLIESQRCASCSSGSLQEVHDFGSVPLAGYFPHEGEPVLPLLPMRMMFCQECSLYQISPDVSDRYLFHDYRYISSIGMQSHFNDLADWFVRTHNPPKESRILEFGCNDGPLLQALTAHGYSPTGIDPAENIVALAKAKGLNVIPDFFNLEAIEKYEQLRDLDYIFSSNSFAHISKIREVAAAVSAALAQGGRFIVEVQSVEQMFEKRAFVFIYHEHKYYYSVISMCNLLGQFEMTLVSNLNIDSHGGSLRLVFEKNSSSSAGNEATEKPVKQIKNVNPEDMKKEILSYVSELQKLDTLIQSMVLQGKRIAAFGASGRANMLLGNLPIMRAALQFVIDESPERFGRLMSQNGVRIISLDEFENQEIDVLVILAWNFADPIIRKLQLNNVDVLVPLPELSILNF